MSLLTMTDFPCRDLDKDCPFRIIDLSKGITICNFYGKFWEVYHNSPIDASNLTQKACDGIRQYELYQEHLAKLTSKRTLKMLKNVKVGVTLFYVPYGEDVILIEKPSELSVITRLVCQRQNKEIVEIPAHLLRQISKRNYYQDYFLHDLNKTREASILEFSARKAGFRVEIEKQKDGFNFRFFGDSQKEVDDFVSIVANNDFYFP